MKKHFFRFLLILAVLGLPVLAIDVWFSAAPGTVENGASYYVEATAFTDVWWEGSDLWLFKNGSYVSGGYGTGYFSTGTWQSDGGPQTIEFYAEAWEWAYGQSAGSWNYVTVNPPPNQAPWGVRDYNHGSVSQYGNLHASGWAVDNEQGAPITRVDILIDGNDVGDANLGGYRPDVADAYGRSDFTYSGWNFDYGIGGLGVGTHSLELRAWDNQGVSTNFGYTTFSVTNSSPNITLLSPGTQTIGLGTALTISSNATDSSGDITTHNLDIQRPDGTWNWQGGFAAGEPYLGGPVGSGSNSTRSASFTFNQVGTWYVRSWVNDSASQSLHSATVAITVVDNVAPSTPIGLSSSALAPTSFTLSWSASSDNVGVTSYYVYRNGTYHGSVSAPNTSMSITGLTQATTYSMTVAARDAAGNQSAQSAVLPVTTTNPLTPPTTIGSVATGSSFAAFSWSGATSSAGIKHYKVFRNGVLIGTTTNPHYTDWTAAPGTAYAYTIKTVDNLDNESAASSALNITTSAATFVLFTPAAP